MSLIMYNKSENKQQIRKQIRKQTTAQRVTLLNIVNWKVKNNNIYIITQVILALWLVLAYDLLENRCTTDVIIIKFFPLCFKMAESFENLDDILRDWEKYKVQKSLAEAWTGSRSRKKKDKAVSFRKRSRKNSRAV